jgi:hypothetical protein
MNGALVYFLPQHNPHDMVMTQKILSHVPGKEGIRVIDSILEQAI